MGPTSARGDPAQPSTTSAACCTGWGPTRCGAPSRCTGRCSNRPTRSRSWPSGCCGRWPSSPCCCRLTHGWGRVRAVLAVPAQRWRLFAAASFVSVNWGVYIWGVNSGHVIETSLGYFINPLFTILLGVVLLGERLRRVQWVAVGDRRAGHRRARRRLRPAAVDRVGAGLQLRHVRLPQEAGVGRRRRVARHRDRVPGRAGGAIAWWSSQSSATPRSPTTVPGTPRCWPGPGLVTAAAAAAVRRGGPAAAADHARA